MRTRLVTSMILAGALASGCGGGRADSTRYPPAPRADTGVGSLAGTEWILVELDGAPVTADSGRTPTLAFDSVASRVTGFAGCNRLSGSYDVGPAGDSLRFGPLVTTKMACEPGMELETRFLAVLEAVKTYQVGPGKLELTGEEDRQARFEARMVSP